MSRKEKWYGWIIVVALCAASIVWGGQSEYTYRYLHPEFFIFAIAIPIVLVVGWLWVKRRIDKQ